MTLRGTLAKVSAELQAPAHLTPGLLFSDNEAYTKLLVSCKCGTDTHGRLVGEHVAHVSQIKGRVVWKVGTVLGQSGQPLGQSATNNDTA